MRIKKYPPENASIAKAPMVREAKAELYSREKNQSYGAQVGLSLSTVKKRLKKPVKRSKPEIAWALEIAGIGEGPANLSERTREYLHNDR